MTKTNNKQSTLHKYHHTSRKSWKETEPVYTEKSLLIKAYQVMQRWEDNYMKSLAAIATSRGGKILEVGFGMGISAGYIQKSPKITSHTVVECHPGVIAFAKDTFKKSLATGRMKLKPGFWEDVTPKMKDKSFDGIFFDSCPLDSGVEFFQFFPFFQEAFRLLKDDGVFTYFSDEATEISAVHKKELTSAGFRNIAFKICKVNPPRTCEYWKHKTIVSPIIKKR